MIIIGYQGIGKSSVAGPDSKSIDLESGNFWVDGERPLNWYKAYCHIAFHLSEQGYIVFMSSHKLVREYLFSYLNRTLNERGYNAEQRSRYIAMNVTIVCPSPDIKDEWIQRLQDRYDKDSSEKNYKALMNAKEAFDQNIDDLTHDNFHYHLIEEIPYDLHEVVYDIILSKLQMQSLFV